MIQFFELLDRSLFLQINGFHTPLMDVFMWQMSESWHTYLFVFVMAFAFYKKYALKKAAEIVIGAAIVIACTDLSSNLVKHAVKRYRPSHNTEIKSQVITVNAYKGGPYGFFSSHAANGIGITAFFYLCLHWLNKKWRLLLFVYPLIICYSRIYLGVRYPSDILFGMLDGFLFS
ncbi:MAG: phosphatase PAP2 family protein [Bacteroidota bacterium]